VAIFLRTERDWIPFLEVIKNAADEYDLWNNIDPSIPKSQLPPLTPPVRPIYTDVIGTITVPAPAGQGGVQLATEREALYSDLSSDDKEEYRVLTEDWRYALRRYDQQHQGISKIRSVIVKMVPYEHLSYTYGQVTLYDLLINLKSRFAPTDTATESQVVLDYANAMKAPTRGTDIEQWTQQVETAYDRGVLLKIPETTGTRPHWAFINATKGIASGFSGTWEVRLVEQEGGDTIPFKDLIRHFRNLRRMASQAPKGITHGAFPTLNGMTQDGQETTPKPLTKCLCGQEHRYNKCYYLMPHLRPANWKPKVHQQKLVDDALKNPSKQITIDRIRKGEEINKSINQRPSELPPGGSGSGQNGGNETEPVSLAFYGGRKAGNQLSKSTDSSEYGQDDRMDNPLLVTAENSANARADRSAYATTVTPANTTTVGSAKSTDNANRSEYSALVTAEYKNKPPYGQFRVSKRSETLYDLHSSIILDSGATCHVGNDRSRFISFTPAGPTDVLYAGENLIQIEGWGTIPLRLQAPGYPNGKVVQVQNVCYVPSFHTNIISLRILNSKEIYWDNKGLKLIWGEHGLHFADTPIYHDQWVLDYVPLKTTSPPQPPAIMQAAFKAHSSRMPRPLNKATFDDWHEIMGHLYPEALNHLTTSCQGVEIDGIHKLSNHKCETCCLMTGKRIPYRYPTKRWPTPFGKVYWDLVSLPNGFSGEIYMLHVIDSCTRMHHVYCLPDHGQDSILGGLKMYANHIRRRWGFRIQILHGDGESALTGNDTREWISTNGIQQENSPPHTQDQNGAAENAGAVIVARGSKMMETANLPEKLWTESLPCAAYLLNRSPTRALGWKTPVGYLEEYLGNTTPLPTLNHLKPYGCRAYSYIKNKPKLDKLKPRAHIGYLVGYDSTNVFRIWIPSLKRVIATRDVVFDTTMRYDPRDDQSTATEEVIRMLEIVSQDVEELVDEWETLPPLQSFERSVNKKGDSIEVDTSRIGHLPTPPGSPQTIGGNTGFTDHSNNQNPVSTTTTGPQSIGASGAVRLEPFDKNSSEQRSSGASTSRTAVNRRKTPKAGTSRDMDVIEPLKAVKPPFAPPEQEARMGTQKGISPANVQTDRLRKRKDAFHVQQIQLSYDSVYHAAFQEGLAYRPGRLHQKDLPAPPKGWRQLLTHQFKTEFMKAAEIEYQTLRERGTFEQIPISTVTKQVLPVMWVFTYKFDEDGYLVKYKARLVIRGDLHNSKYNETYAATLAARIFRALMGIAAYFDLDILQFDAINAFTNAYLDELVYMKFPDGYTVPGSCLRVIRALYGLPRSPLLWHGDISKTMVQKLGLRPVPESQCLFTNGKLIVFFYVDDVAVLCHPSNHDAYLEFRTGLMDAYNMREIGPLNWFLGIRVVRDRYTRKIWLCQDAYIDKIVKRFQKDPHNRAKAPKTPMTTDPLYPFEGTAQDLEIKAYQQKVGSLTYPAAITRPDMSYTTKCLAEHLQNPGPLHEAAADRCVDYLSGTRWLALELGGIDCDIITFLAAGDASFADHLPTRRSTEGYLIQLLGGTIDWSSKVQPTVSTSTTEAELRALAHTVQWILWWGRFFSSIHLDLEEDPTVYCDNLQAVGLMIKDSPKLVTKLKHVDIHQHWLREVAAEGTVKIEWIQTSDMAADGLTKSLTIQQHAHYVNQLNMVDIRGRIKDL
jgi:hypothetical protein